MKFFGRMVKISVASAVLALLVLMVAPKSSVLGQIGYQIVAATATITNDLTVGGQINMAIGSQSAPSVIFTGTDTGIYGGDDDISFGASNVRILRIDAGGLVAVTGSLTSPTYSFASDVDTGMYFSGTAGGVAFASGGKDLGQWYVATGTLTATQVRKLNATPVEVIATPGAGLAIFVESAQFMLDYGGTVYDSVGNGEDIIALTTTTSVNMVQCDETTCLQGDATTDKYGMATTAGVSFGSQLVTNSGISLTISVAEWATTDDDSDGNSPIHYLIRYRIMTADLS